MTDIAVNIEAACAAARRYAQLIYYHDHKAHCNYDSRPYASWANFIRQFYAIPRGAVIASIISHSYVMELRRLSDANRARSNVEGQSSATAQGRQLQHC